MAHSRGGPEDALGIGGVGIESTIYPHSITWNEMNLFQFTLYGLVYITCTDFLLYPADLLTTRLQADKFNTQKGSHAFRLAMNIIKRDGIFGLYRGFIPATIGSFPGQFSYYITYEWVNEQLLKYSNPSHGLLHGLMSHCISGLAAEAVSGLVYVPTDIISQRLQAQHGINFLYRKYQFKGTSDVVKHIFKYEGCKGLYRGYGPYLAVFGPGSAIWWSSYEVFKKLSFIGFKKLDKIIGMNSGKEVIQTLSHLVSGAFAGICSCLVTNPLDVARTRIQLLEATNIRESHLLKRGFFNLLFDIHQKEGWRGLYKGVKPRIFIKVPGSSIALLGYEWLKESSTIKMVT